MVNALTIVYLNFICNVGAKLGTINENINNKKRQFQSNFISVNNVREIIINIVANEVLLPKRYISKIKLPISDGRIFVVGRTICRTTEQLKFSTDRASASRRIDSFHLFMCIYLFVFFSFLLKPSSDQFALSKIILRERCHLPLSLSLFNGACGIYSSANCVHSSALINTCTYDLIMMVVSVHVIAKLATNNVVNKFTVGGSLVV